MTRRPGSGRGFAFGGGDTVGDLLMHYPDLSPPLIEAGIDPVRDRDATVADCCARLGRDQTDLLERLALLARKPAWGDDEDWSQASLQDMVDHVVARHHAYLDGELPRLLRLAQAIAARCPGGAALHARLAAFAAAIASHLRREEDTLFPACIELDHAAAHDHLPDGPLLRVAVQDLEDGHQFQLDELPAMLGLVGSLPEAPCDLPFRAALIQGLLALADDLADHHRKEEEYLLPAALHAQEVLSTGIFRHHPEWRP